MATKIETQIARMEKQLAELKAQVKTEKQMGFVKPAQPEVTPEIKAKVADLIAKDASRDAVRENGYKWPCYMASKVYYAAKAVGGTIDPAKMNDNTALVCAKAYGLLK